ncbi:MAG: diguanylate cyclase [Proteobacteria bacterium]|nr:diguanylate cyclase [Pseudomonadota bacterium]
MLKARIAPLSKSPPPANSLTQVLGQSERIKDVVEECADDLSSVNAGLKRELLDGGISPGIENALEESEAIEGKVQDASQALSLVNIALKEEVQGRAILQERLAVAVEQGDEARHASLHDPLTGLPNRALFNDRLEHGLAHAKRNGISLVVMFVDLDDFKSINDSHGHDVGDIVLTTIAARIKQASRDEDTVCRHGGDEFLYMLVEVRNEADIATIAEKIIAMVKVPCNIRIRDIDLSLVIHPSIGVAIFPADGTTADSLVANADKAMYQAKRNKSGYSLFADLTLSPG